MWGVMLGPPRTPQKAWKSAVSAGTAFSQRSAPELIEANHPTTQVKRSLLPWQQMGSDNKMNSHFWSSKNSFCFALSPVIWTTPSNTSQITQLKTQSTFKKTQTGWKVCGKVTVPEKARLMAFACVHRTTHASIFPLQAAGWVQRNLPKCLTHVHTVFFLFLNYHCEPNTERDSEWTELDIRAPYPHVLDLSEWKHLTSAGKWIELRAESQGAGWLRAPGPAVMFKR